MQYRDRTLRFLNATYRIKYVDTIPSDEGNIIFGQCDIVNRIILVATKSPDGKSYPQDRIEQTLRHELMYMVCFEGQYHDEYQDEPFIEWLAKSIGILKKNGLI